MGIKLKKKIFQCLKKYENFKLQFFYIDFYSVEFSY